MGKRNSVFSSIFAVLWKILLFVVILLSIATYWLADDLTFKDVPLTYANDYRYFAVKTRDQTRVACRFLANPSSDYLLVFSHGNSEDLGVIENLLNGFRRTGISVIAYDYPGYGLSEGKPTEKGCYDALDAVIHFAVDELRVPPEKIILHGRSMGSGPSIEICNRYELGGLILESAYLSAFRTSIGIGFFPWDRFKNDQKIERIQEPTLVVHGANDEIVPFAHAKQIFGKLRCPKLYYWIEDAGHNDVATALGGEYWNMIASFIRYLEVDL